MPYNKKYYRELRQWYIDAGICFTCKKRPVENGETRCLICKMDNREKCRKWRDKMSDKQREKGNEARRKRKEQLRAVGICIDCGKRSAVKNRVRCDLCLRRNREHKNQTNHDNGTIPRELRGNGVYCAICCKPLCDGKKLCTRCYTNACKALEKGRANIDRDKHPWKIKNKILFEGV